MLQPQKKDSGGEMTHCGSRLSEEGREGGARPLALRRFWCHALTEEHVPALKKMF